MTNYFLLSYDSVPLGIYNKLCYLLDYILELARFPGKNLLLTKIRIYNFNVNIAYPDSTLVFKPNETKEKIFLEEISGKRVEMCQETFRRFKKIQKYYKKTNKSKIQKKDVKPETIPEKNTLEDKANIEDIKKEINEKQSKLNEEHKKTIYEMNRLKHQIKMVSKWQNKFKEDLKLYKKFQESKKEDEDFKIPEMFEETFNFFEESEKPEETFTEYFVIFNDDSNLEIEEINELLGEIENDSDNEDSD